MEWSVQRNARRVDRSWPLCHSSCPNRHRPDTLAFWGSPVDLLTDILLRAGLERRILHQQSLPADGTLDFPCDRSFGFHVVVHGDAYIHAAGSRDPIVLHAGDVALMARGRNHVVASRAAVPARGRAGAARRSATPETAPSLVLVSGAYKLRNAPVHPFFHELPDWYVMRADEFQGLDATGITLKLLASEAREPQVGSETVTQALLDILFTHVLRRVLARTTPAGRTWGEGVRHPQVCRALDAMHAHPAKGWTLDELARHAGISRSGLAQKFRHTVGSSPLQYLTTLRVQRAMELLANTDDKLATVAQAVGYQDAFTFSKVFKKVAGESPRAFRERDRGERVA